MQDAGDEISRQAEEDVDAEPAQPEQAAVRCDHAQHGKCAHAVQRGKPRVVRRAGSRMPPRQGYLSPYRSFPAPAVATRS